MAEGGRVLETYSETITIFAVVFSASRSILLLFCFLAICNFVEWCVFSHFISHKKSQNTHQHFHKLGYETLDTSEWWTPWMHWPLSSGRLFHPPSLLTALHPSISTHVDETEIDEDIPDGQPFHSNTPNEFWLPRPTLLCRRLILTQAAFPPRQFCVLRGLFFGDKTGFTWLNLVKPPFGTSSNVEFHT